MSKTSQAQRGNKNVGMTLPPWAIKKLARLALFRGLTKSGVIQELIAGEPEPPEPPVPTGDDAAKLGA